MKNIHRLSGFPGLDSTVFPKAEVDFIHFRQTPKCRRPWRSGESGLADEEVK